MGATISAPVPTIKQKWRDHPPSSYSLKIQNFSQLENSTASSDHKYQSRFFSSGDPKGNVKDNGSGFISMYVEVDSTSLVSTPPTEVFAKLRFFVYNKKINKYFTIQDVEVKRFNALKLVWGLLKGGQCEFGIDVIVPPPLTNWEIVSFDEKLLSYPKFSWTVKNFSELREEIYTSNSFPMGGRKWVLKVYPKGRSRADGKYLSVFLYLADSEILKPDEKIFMQGIVRLRNPFGSNHLAHQISCWHEEKKNGWGWDNFVRLAELKQTYLDKEDTLKFETEFKVVSEAKYSPINT
ncbi:PREDICTED: uncharacterized protein LOC104788033 isoform X2 [Camelina sativa]|uniref:Uncharacterized protein LOC104788033 isoform X2 n=1 Tax=Camelina sativa TaxID=90675 RepID=A0ABM0Z8R3_CAMSA|nr:PREDICTED: uncharacterized protein LOC104788033 isoform X2 [Camelina sativa]